MNKLIVRTLGGAALLVVAVVSGFNPGTARPAHADLTNIFLVNQGICLALTSSTFAGCAFPASLGYNNKSGDTNLLLAADALGNNNGVIEPSDFANVANLSGQGSKSGAQIHQADGGLIGGVATNVLAVIAFVANDAPVTFHTNAGFFIESQSATWFCNGTPAPASQQNADSDCGRGPLNDTSSSARSLNEDHVVVATLACSLATCPNLGPAELTVEQDGIIFPMKFTVVGEPRTVQFFTLEKAIQAGVPVIGTLSNRSNAPTEPNPCVPPACTPVASATACPFAANIDFITKALAQAEKTVVVARALDINGTSIAGAWVDWTVDNAGVGTDTATFNKDNSIPTNFDSQGILSQPITPTLNLGGFGFGAPNILCAPANAVAGKVTVRATLTSTTPGSPGVSVDPGAALPPATAGAWAETTFNVNAIPAKLTLTADPPSIPCDGTTTSTVSAALTDAAGNPAISGTAVSFSSPILGTANPLSTTTNDKGVATSVITPLSSGQAGTTVVVSVAVGGVNQTNLTQSILVQCGAAAPAGAPGGAAPGGAPGAAGAAPIGITAPNTGSGPLGAGAAAGLTWWPALALIAAAGALATARFALKRAR